MIKKPIHVVDRKIELYKRKLKKSLGRSTAKVNTRRRKVLGLCVSKRHFLNKIKEQPKIRS